MAVVITVEQVREFMGPDYADVPTSTIETYICLVNKIDSCLDSNYPDNDCTQNAIKNNAIGHLISMTSGKFIKSQRSPSGASRTFELTAKGIGLDSTPFGMTLKVIDTLDCFIGLFPSGSFGVVGLGRKCKDY